MRIRTMAGIAVAGAAVTAAVIGGVAAADDNEPVVRIVTNQEAQAQPEEDCPEKGGTAPAPEGTGL